VTTAVALVVAAALAAPAVPPAPPAHVIPVANLAPGTRRPVVIFLHGLGGSGADTLADPAIRAWAEQGRIFLVAPDGTLDRQGRRFWNAGGACCNFDRRPVDDLARLETLIDYWRQRPDIDPARVYVVGFSNGGFMAHRLACWMDDRLAAVVSVAGAGRMRDEACAVSTSLAIVEAHGDADPIVRYEGGRVFDSRELDPHPSAPDTIRDWAARLDCPARLAPRTTTADLDPRLPGAETKLESHRCPRGVAELWTVHGGEHRLLTPALVSRIGAFLLAHPKAAARSREPKSRKPR
jgi:polyhydroxybutyrate depolymerase